MENVNTNGIAEQMPVADIADTIEPELKKRIAGHSDPGYRLAAEESAKAVVKAILTGKINNLKVEY